MVCGLASKWVRKRKFFPVRAEAREFASRVTEELRAAAGIMRDAAPMELAQALVAWREGKGTSVL